MHTHQPSFDLLALPLRKALCMAAAATAVALPGMVQAQANQDAAAAAQQARPMYKCTQGGQVSYQATPCSDGGGVWVDEMTRKRQIAQEQRIYDREQERVDRLQMQRFEMEQAINSVRQANATAGVDPTLPKEPSDIPDISELKNAAPTPAPQTPALGTGSVPLDTTPIPDISELKKQTPNASGNTPGAAPGGTSGGAPTADAIDQPAQ